MNDSTPDRHKASQEARTRRLKGRVALRKVTTDLRCYDCGREPVGAAVEFRKTREGIVGLAGLASCGRVWLCPVCNAKVMARRALEIGVTLAWADRAGLDLLWGSLTVRHNSASDLGHMLQLQRDSWRTLVSRMAWRKRNTTVTVAHGHTPACDNGCDRKLDIRDTGAQGRVGYIRASEITVGVNGWHPHFHPMLVWRGDRAAAQRFADWTVENWVHAVEQHGGEARMQGGQQLRLLDRREAFSELSGYVTKSTYDAARLALEVVWSQGKNAPPGRRVAKTAPHWSLLAQIETGEFGDDPVHALDRWEQLEEAVPGHRMIAWSRGLRSFAGIGEDEQTDEEIAAEEAGTRNDAVCFITPAGWDTIRDNGEVLGLMLNTLESAGWEGLQVLLDVHGVEYFTNANLIDSVTAERVYSEDRWAFAEAPHTPEAAPRTVDDYAPLRYTDPEADARFWAEYDEKHGTRTLVQPTGAPWRDASLF